MSNLLAIAISFTTNLVLLSRGYTSGIILSTVLTAQVVFAQGNESSLNTVAVENSSVSSEINNVNAQRMTLPDGTVITNLSEKISPQSSIEQSILPAARTSNNSVLFLDGKPDSEESKKSLAELKKNGVKVIHFDFSTLNKTIEKLSSKKSQLSSSAKQQLSKFKNWWDKNYEAPLESERHFGVVTTALRTGIYTSIWYSVGLDPVTATVLVTGQSIMTYINTTYERTLDNIFGISKDPKLAFKQMAYRVLYTAFWTYLWRGISGPVKSAHSILSIQGNFEILSYLFSTAWAGNKFGLEKVKMLSREASAMIGFQAFLMGAVLSNLDLAGVNLYSWDINFKVIEILGMKLGGFTAEIKSSTLFIMGYYLSLTYILRSAPQYFESYARLFDDLFSKLKNFRFNCQKVFLTR